MADSDTSMAGDAVQREPEYVGFWKRAFASFIDTVILVTVIGIVIFSVYGSQYVQLKDAGRTALFDFLTQWLFPTVAAILFWRYRGATPGKILISAKIVDAKTLGAPSTGQLVGRYFAYLVSSIFMLGFIWIAFDKRKKGWHDKLAGTVVIRAEDD